MGNVGGLARSLAALSLAAWAVRAVAYDPTPPPMGREPWDAPVNDTAQPLPPPREIGHSNPFKACHTREDGAGLIDAAAQGVQETVCGAALWFDGLFGERDLASARSAWGRLEVSTAQSEFEGQQTRIRFDARVQLPSVEHRLSAFIGRDNEEDVARDRREGLGLRSQADQLNQVEDWFAGLGYRMTELWGIRSELRVGVRGVANPTAFVQVRSSYTAYEDYDDRILLRGTPFVNNQDGAGFTAAAYFDHALSVTRLARLASIGTVSEESEGVQWRNAAILYQNLRRLRAIAFEAFVRGETAAPEPLLEYGVRSVYRQPFFDARLFGELVLGYSWPRVDPALEREGSAGITAGLELPFGSRGQPAPVPNELP